MPYNISTEQIADVAKIAEKMQRLTWRALSIWRWPCTKTTTRPSRRDDVSTLDTGRKLQWMIFLSAIG